MKPNFIFILAVAAVLAACNNKPNENNIANTSDTSQTTAKQDVTQTPPVDTTQPMAVAIPDSTFLATAYNIGVFETKIAKLADKKSQDSKVKDFANMMIEQHTAMGKDVLAMLHKKNYAVPNDLPADLKDKWTELNKLTGKDFDKKYAEINVNGHKEAIEMFKSVLSNSKDADVKKLAGDALPKLQTHESHALAIQTAVNS
jgi:putative membrane protein